MEDKSSNASSLLNSLMGQVTEKQKEIYKKIKYAQGDLVVSEIMSDSQSSDSEMELDCPVESKLKTSNLVDNSSVLFITSDLDEIQINSNQINQPSVSNKKKDELWDSSLPFKYMNGAISFNELTNIMETKLLNSISPSTEQKEEAINEDFFTENLITDDEDEISSESDEDPDWRPAEEFEKELNANQHGKAKNRLNTTLASGSRRKKLAKDLLGLVGQANLHFARGDHDGAIKMCLEVIRLAPTSPEPFQTLSMVYEEKKEFEKAYQYNLISAYLSPSDGENWIKVAEMAVEQKKYAQAITCYSKAIKIYPNNFLLHIERCKLYELLDDKKKALDCYESLLYLISSRKTDNIQTHEIALQIAKEIAKIHYFNKNVETSIKVMEENFKKYQSSIINEDVNLYLELLISSNQYIKALNVFIVYCGIKFKLNNVDLEEITEEILTENKDQIEIVLLFRELQIDLRSKLAVCLINLEIFKYALILEKFISKENPNEMGDLYLDIADAYIKVNHFEEAATLLKELVYSRTYNCSAVWIRYARCLKKLNKIDESINAYYEVIRQSPKFNEAKLELSELLIQVGRDKDATEATGQSNNNEISLDLLFLRCNLLFKQEIYEEFLSACKILLASEFTFLANESEISVMITSTSQRTRIDALKEVHKEQGDKLDISELTAYNYNYVGNRINASDLLDIYVKYCYVLDKFNKKEELVKTVFSAYTCSSFTDKDMYLDYVALTSLFKIRNIKFSYLLAKAIVFRNLNNNQVWNLFSLLMRRFYQDLRHNKFCLRLFVKHPDNLALAYINGHNALTSGSYKHALAEYVNIFKQNPNDTFAVFSIVIGFTHLACQKFITNRHLVVAQLTAFLNLYLEIRGECQESYYNAGRVMHQLGLMHEAIHFYKQALEVSDIIDCDAEEKQDVFDLKKEISFNLSLIYQNSGNNLLALHYIKKYFVI